ncbi:MAG: hypothetical protein ACI85I_000001, partial [Arenicella sp.]
SASLIFMTKKLVCYYTLGFGCPNYNFKPDFMKIVKITLIPLFVSTAVFFQSEKKMMSSIHTLI